MLLSIIAAKGTHNEIGLNKKLPWNLPSDLKRFKQLTTGHTIIMGQITHESIGRPLPERTNVVISHHPDYRADGCLSAHSLQEAISLIPPSETEAFVIGGSTLYAAALPLANRLYITEVEYSGPADTYFPDINRQEWQEISQEIPTQTEKDEYPFKLIIYNRIGNS